MTIEERAERVLERLQDCIEYDAVAQCGYLNREEALEVLREELRKIHNEASRGRVVRSKPRIP